MIELRRGSASVSWDPDAGGRIASLRIDGVQRLVTQRDRADATTWGWFPMVPFAGRVGRARFTHAGRSWQVPARLGPHGAHGTVLDQPWRVEHHGAHLIVASCDLGPAWPWAARAQSRIELHRGALRWHLSVSTATESFPAQVGWHPWFSDAGRSPALDLHAQAMYRRNAAGLPDGSMVAPGPHPWDDCFVGVSDAPQLTYTDGVVLTIASDCDHWVVYEPDHAVCVEPQSGPPDGFRLAPQLIEPNRPLGRTMLVTWDTP